MTIFRSVLIGVFCAVFALPAWADGQSCGPELAGEIMRYRSGDVNRFLKYDCVIDNQNWKIQETPLEWAIGGYNNIQDNYTAVKAFLDAKPELANSVDYGHQHVTMLAEAVRSCCNDKEAVNKPKIVKELLEHGAEVNKVLDNIKNDHGTLSHVIVIDESKRKVTALDVVRAYIESANKNGTTCKTYGIKHCTEIEQMLLDYGAKTYAELNGDAPAPSAELETVSQPVATASAPAQTESEPEPEVTPVIPAAESKTTNSVAAKLTDISVSGIVVDGKTDKPIPFLSMILVDSEGKQISYSDGVSSDANGKFERTFRNVPADAKILISKYEYKKQTLTPGLNMKIVMLPSTELNAVKVAADRVSCEPEELESLYAVAGKINRDGDGTAVCIPTLCINDYDLRDGECVMRMQDVGISPEELQARQDKAREGLQRAIDGIELESDCDDTDRHIKKGTFRDTGKEMLCAPLECEAGYVISRNGNECTECKRGSHVKSMTSQDNKCVIESCDKDYLIKEDKCVKNCGKGWHPDESKTRCVEGAEEPAPVDPEKIAELQNAYDDAKAKETSTANRLLGAAGIAATGLGGMQLAQGLTEMSVDADTEEDMRKYLETFSCTYGVGGLAKGGDTNVDVNGTNALTKLYTEYTQTADSVKKKKTALGMRPGIESEVIIDATTSGLYDDETRVSGSISGLDYASFARSILYPDGEDAAQWAEHKQGAKTRALVGGGVAAVGVVGGLVGNSLINGKLGEKLKEAKDKKTTISAFKDILTNAGMTNVDSLDLSKLDWTALKGIDISQFGNLKGKDAAKLDTSSNEAFINSLRNQQ